MNNDILENILQEFSKVNGRLDKIDNRLDKVDERLDKMENQQEVCSLKLDNINSKLQDLAIRIIMLEHNVKCEVRMCKAEDETLLEMLKKRTFI